MEAFLVPLLPPVALAIALWAWVVWLSFRAIGRVTRRVAAAVSMILSICGSIAFLGLTSLDDVNAHPGYTCALRDGSVPSGFASEQLPPPHPDWTGLFYPSVDWSHDYELLPAGVRCTYRSADAPGITVVTHSPWSYSVWVYGLLVIALVQGVRIVNPDVLAPWRPRARREQPGIVNPGQG